MNGRVSSPSPNTPPGVESWSAARHTLFLRVYSADELQYASSQSSYCKLYLGDSPVVTASRSMSRLFKSNRDNLSEHRTFHTKVCTSQVKTVALWNEKFEMPVDNIEKDILSIRVKSQLPMYSPSIGSCAIQLSQLNPGATVDQTFPLVKGEKTVGSIRLQLMIRENGGNNYAKPGGRKASKVKYSEKGKRVTRHDDRGNKDFEAEFKQREKELQFAREKKRMEEEIEELRREEEERKRRRQQAEEDDRRRLEAERRRLEAERLAAIETEKQRAIDEELRRKAQKKQKKQQEEAIMRRQSESVGRRQTTNQANDSDDDLSFEDHWQALSQHTVRSEALAPQLMPPNYDSYMYGEDGGFERVDMVGPSDATAAMRRRGTISNGGSASGSASGGGRNHRSTLSITDLDTVVQDALPSDSDDTDSADEQEYIRQIAKLKLKMKAKAKALAAKKKQQRQHSQSVSELAKTKKAIELDEPKARRRKTYVVSVSSSSSESDSDSDSESEDSSSSDEESDRGKHRSRKSSKKTKKKKLMKKKKTSKKKDKTRDHGNQYGDAIITSGALVSLTPMEITERMGQSSNQLDVEQIMAAAVTAARAVMPGDMSDMADMAVSMVGDGISLVGDGVCMVGDGVVSAVNILT